MWMILVIKCTMKLIKEREYFIKIGHIRFFGYYLGTDHEEEDGRLFAISREDGVLIDNGGVDRCSWGISNLRSEVYDGRIVISERLLTKYENHKFVWCNEYEIDTSWIDHSYDMKREIK